MMPYGNLTAVTLYTCFDDDLSSGSARSVLFTCIFFKLSWGVIGASFLLTVMTCTEETTAIGRGKPGK